MDSRAEAFLVASVALAALFAGCTTGPGGEPDADGDGLLDVDEAGGWVIAVEREDGNVTRTVTSDPARADSDGDGLSDLAEYQRGADPREVDTDGDGLLDGKAMRVIDDSDLGKAFADWGIRHDPVAKDRWLGEADYCPENNGLHPAKWDSDRPFPDGISDASELLGWNVTVGGETRAVLSSPCLTDSDGDGLKDGDEKARATDPQQRDTDGDGAWDFVDADPLADLGIRAIVESVRLAGDVPAGATLLVTVNAGGREETAERPARAGGNTVDASVSNNVEDAGDPRVRALSVQVLVRVTLVDGDSRRALDLSGSTLLEARFDVVRGAWSHDGASDSGPLETTGADGTLVVSFARAEY